MTEANVLCSKFELQAPMTSYLLATEDVQRHFFSIARQIFLTKKQNALNGTGKRTSA